MSLIAFIIAALVVALALTIGEGQGSRTPDPAAFTAAELESLQLGPFTMVTTVAQTLDSLLCDNYGGAEWLLTFEKSDGTRLTRRVVATHNGTNAADATVATCSITGSGISSELTSLDVDLSGVGAAQTLRLRCTMTFGAGTWKISPWRIPQKPPQYS
jgi:hypothetical protein